MLRILIEHDTNNKIQPTLINNLGSSVIDIMLLQVIKQICLVHVIQVLI